MEDLPADIKAFLMNHPFFELTDDGKKIKCVLNGHDCPCNLTELQNFTKGKKYQKMCSNAEFKYSQYEPHVVPSSKQPNHLFCKLTLRHINRLPHHVLQHVNGKRFQKAKKKYEECLQQGVEYMPASLQQKKPRDREKDGERGRNFQRGNGAWAPDSSDEGGSDSEDSMSDLYPSTLFSLKKETEGMEEEKDAFKTDDEEMEIDKQAPQKRKKVRWLNPRGTVFFTSSVEQCSKQTGLHVVVELL
ncbi:surfeit locus protein 2 isoform X1 [Oncorhynchus mykiss]|uniref:surfeit locus protein 2 isoform X1 n=1 Tax=Oncorhynchus mykiss TaxID=8022 RepID=UPI000B4F60E5|nr:surfeit locus protein 2 isoform X1 [Oncorhynchus mykiss]